MDRNTFKNTWLTGYKITETDYSNLLDSVRFFTDPISSSQIVDLPNFNDLNQLLFNTSPTGISSNEGAVYWNKKYHTLNVQTEIPGVIIKLGEEEQRRVYNGTGTILTNGTVVYPVNAVQDPTNPDLYVWSVDRTDPTNQLKASVFGVITADIAPGAIGRVTVSGEVHNIDTTGFPPLSTLYVSTVSAGVLSNIKPTVPNYAITVGKVIQTSTSGTIYIRAADSNSSISLTNNFGSQQDPTGWVNNSGITISYSASARTITLTGDLRYMWQGDLKTLTSPWVSSPHASGDANYYLYSTDGVNISWNTSVWDFTALMICGVTLQTSISPRNFALSELHSLMPWQAHREFHQTIGCYRLTGGGLTPGSYVLNSALDTDTTPSFDSATVKDEDNITIIPSLLKGSYTNMYIGPNSKAYISTGNAFPFLSSGSYMLVNDPISGVNNVGINKGYYNVYQILIPVASDSQSQLYRMIMLQPQATYSTLTAAQGENTNSLIFGDLSAQIAEYVLYSRITYYAYTSYANTGKCSIAGVSYLSGSKLTQISSGFAGMSNPMTTQGSLILGGIGGVPTELFKGAPLQIPHVTADGSTIEYINFTSSNIGNTVNTISSNYTVSGTDYIILANAASGNIIITLYTAINNKGKVLKFKKIDSSANTITIDGNGSETIDGSITKVLSTQYSILSIVSDGTNWYIF